MHSLDTQESHEDYIVGSLKTAFFFFNAQIMDTKLHIHTQVYFHINKR